MAHDEDRFYADPLLPALFRKEEDDYFALGLVINWPVGKAAENNNDGSLNVLQQHYDDFLSTVQRTCFQHDNGDHFFCVPLHSLHITLASLFSAKRISELPSSSSTTPDDWTSTFVTEWKEVLMKAVSLDDWPRKDEPIEIRIDSARVAPRAGILLWTESSSSSLNGIERMRNCLRCAVQSVHPHLQRYLRIPNIIHSTFVRYINPPSEQNLRPSHVHSILLEQVVSRHPLFGKDIVDHSKSDSSIAPTASNTIRIDCAKLVNCKIYLQDFKGDVDHEVYLTVPCCRSTQATNHERDNTGKGIA
jgi:hypothetical protein